MLVTLTSAITMNSPINVSNLSRIINLILASSCPIWALLSILHAVTAVSGLELFSSSIVSFETIAFELYSYGQESYRHICVNRIINFHRICLN
jgi:hypothetical protein